LIEELVPDLRAREITLAIENRQLQSPEEIKDLVVSIGAPHVRVCVDFLNSLYHLAGPREAIETLGPFAATSHVKDATVSRCGGGFIVRSCILGQGIVDFAAAFDRLCSTGNLLSMHVESYVDRSDATEELLRREEECVRKGLSFLAEARRCREPSNLGPGAHDGH
jgi:sugar phosphate isomerase/epimerase